MENEYKPGDRDIIIASLNELQIVDENSLEWEQVIEFRKDKDARKKYRGFVHWLDKEMVGKPTPFIIDEIDERLEKYEWAIKKHGIKTVLGGLYSAVDLKSLLGSAVALGSLTLIGQELLGQLAAISTITAKCAIKVATALVDIEDIKRGAGSEVAYAYEVKRKFGKK
ncbi:hypothetical protein [Desulfobacter curvatus]|uniref:hypothetical protein n=1 Tax=Desulfobacter curvatus TaxID=2290 RepID=UPI000381D34A|nr:hypothetical protein [Desulfobacter curvatus]